MPYAHRPLILDADTHMMEHADWLPAFADPDIRPRLVPFAGKDARVRALAADAVARAEARRSDATLRAEAEAEFMSMKFKGWHGLGAFDAAERRRANDLMGFGAYLVFPTEAFNQVIAAEDAEVLRGGIRALNRGLASFCGEDRRMGGVAYLRLADGPEAALASLEEIVALGLPALLVDTLPPPGGMGFTHPDYDPLWARIQDLGLAVTLHIGARGAPYEPVPRAVFNNGRHTPVHRNGDAPADAVSYMGMPFEAQVFLSAMVFDGVLERFPRLRIAVVELGASWVVSFLKHLDQSYRAFRRLQDLSEVKRLPSEYLQSQVKVTPFAGEDIGWLLSQGAADMLMFASDYPHHEGTDDPIGRYERTLGGVDEPLKANFYHRNFEALFADRKWW
ncbi:MAG: hypothetical protein RL588_1420 [Pseudomonadota bacterium]|jgi:predicted TIM-barrel fold metal-dependent hydrolase